MCIVATTSTSITLRKTVSVCFVRFYFYGPEARRSCAPRAAASKLRIMTNTKTVAFDDTALLLLCAPSSPTQIMPSLLSLSVSTTRCLQGGEDLKGGARCRGSSQMDGSGMPFNR